MCTDFQVSGQQILEATYRAALSETDKSQLPERIAEAEKALCYGRGNCFRQPAITAKRLSSGRRDVRFARFTKQLPNSGAS